MILNGNAEELCVKFIESLDKNPILGPKELNGVSFSKYNISDVIGCTDEIVEELFSRPSEFFFDDNDQIFVKVFDKELNEERIVYLSSDLSDPSFQVSCEAISQILPDIPYDLECGGFASRQSEAASLYKLCILNSLQEGCYSLAIKKILAGYDFSRWTAGDNQYAFTNLLERVKEDADPISRVVLSLLNKKLIADRVKKDTSYKGILKEEDAEKLRLLSVEAARLNFEYNKKYEGSSSNKEKILIGEQFANARTKMLSNCSDDIIILFKIFDLNQNAIPARAKRIIRNSASEFINDLVLSKILKDEESSAEFKKKLVQRAQRLYLSRMKEIRYKLWNNRTINTDLSELLPKF